MAIKDLAPWNRGERRVPVRRDEEENPFYSLQRNMNRLFEDFFRGFDQTPFGPFGEQIGAFSPRLDVRETETDVKVSAELPGLDEKDIEVSLAHNVLTISGQKREEKEDKGQNYYRMERSYGSFRRSIPLPYEVESDKVDATFKKGVLTITLPKTPEAQEQRKKITIKAG